MWHWKTPEVIGNYKYKISGDVVIQYDHDVLHRKPDIVLVDKEKRTCIIIDTANPKDNRVVSNNEEKQDKCLQIE